MQQQPYVTDELELAAFLKATGHRLLGLRPTGRLVSFSFDASASPDVENIFQVLKSRAENCSKPIGTCVPSSDK